jgi:hypothetical protein
MGREGSLPRSQQATSGPCHEPYESILQPEMQFP